MTSLKPTIITSVLLIAVFCNKNPVSSDVSTVTDIDGNVYNSIKIGSQIWMVENFRATRCNDGSAIPLVENDSSWLDIYDSKIAGCCFYNNINNQDSIKKYGVLYNWNAVKMKNFVPAGWHVPSKSEWMILDNYLSENGKGYFDTSGFSAVPGGYRYFSGEFIQRGHCGRWWSSSERGDKQAYCYLRCTDSKDTSDFTDKNAGLLVRLIRN